MENLYVCVPIEKYKERNIEKFSNFDSKPPQGYITGFSPNPDVQNTYEAGASLLYLTRTNASKDYTLPDPTKGTGIVGWSIVMINEADQVRIQSTVRTHARLPDNQYPGCSQYCGWGNSVDSITTNNDLKALFNGNHGISIYIQPPLPTPVVNLSFTNITTNSFTVNWQGGDNATNYIFTLNNNAATPNNSKDALSNKVASFSNLNPGTRYNVSIIANNPSGNSNPGNGNTTTIAPPPPPPPPAPPAPPASSSTFTPPPSSTFTAPPPSTFTPPPSSTFPSPPPSLSGGPSSSISIPSPIPSDIVIGGFPSNMLSPPISPQETIEEKPASGINMTYVYIGIAVVVVLIGGVMFMGSGGNSEND
jgi:hypothetical protein